MRGFLLLGAVAALFQLSGCAATSMVAGAVVPTEPGIDTVEEVRSGWRTAAGDVVLCVVGHPAGEYLLWTSDYAITVPAGVLGVEETADSGRPFLRRFVVGPRHVRQACPPFDGRAPASATPVPVVEVPLSWAGATELAEMTDVDLATLLAQQTEVPAILVIGPDRDLDVDIVYLPSAPASGDRPAIEIYRDRREVAPNPAAIPWIPAAVAADIAAVPVFLLYLAFGGRM